MKATIKQIKGYPASKFVLTHSDGTTETIYNAKNAYSRLKYLNSL